ncbi:hypothetical protein QT339_27620 (plasmid) [Escherichia coli]|nr:hypothetical protein [Escherichia coli]
MFSTNSFCIRVTNIRCRNIGSLEFTNGREPLNLLNKLNIRGYWCSITQKVLYKAVSKLLGMSGRFPQTFRLNVNVTPALLKDTHFVQMCKLLSDEKGARLMLELTEQQPFTISYRQPAP